MSERNYENLYWEAQKHIDELEGENAALRLEKEELRIEGNRLYGIGQEYDEENAALKRENRGLIKKSIAKEEHIHMLMDRIDALPTGEKQ